MTQDQLKKAKALDAQIRSIESLADMFITERTSGAAVNQSDPFHDIAKRFVEDIKRKVAMEEQRLRVDFDSL